ncbi:DNA cytosine methyltransferase [Sphingomicrobium arenosum]|uniref:DNA cytosine methyltransferase n=1 Tax=Sphingomicrobium arenosum TaxID=2233861 RepID=UPI002240F329|nr:DNA cytosine methyltransferase [Sphingomicrobium arenosum]
MAYPSYTAVDLFAGCGGLSVGLSDANIRILGAVECDNLAAETYRLNHPKTKVFESDIRGLDPSKVRKSLGLEKGELTLLAGCPPCQGFSSLRTRNGGYSVSEPMNDLVFEFERFCKEFRPRLIMLENVPGLSKDVRLKALKTKLSALGYKCKSEVFNAINFGAAQKRRRMILIGSLDSEPDFAPPLSASLSVRDLIAHLPEPSKSKDAMHNYPVKRSDKVNEIISKIPKDGGSRSSLPFHLVLECHKKTDGYKDVYGRMAWDKPAPTITGGCINPSRGRFLHPEQDRAITLREAAILQGFPASYAFSAKRGRYPIAQMIGNAFPPSFAKLHAARLLQSLGSS